MAKYLEYFRISFLNILAFRARYYVGITTYLIYIAIYYYIWKAIYEHAASINSFSLKEMTTYVAVGWVARSFIFNNLDREIEARVVDGSLSMDLLKPVDFQGMQYSRVFGEAIFRLVLFALPTALIAGPLFHIGLPPSFEAAAMFFCSTFLAAFIFVSVNFLVGSLAIPLKSIEGIAYAKQNLILFLSGLMIPFDMLPKKVAAVLNLLPFAGISYQPLSIYLGKVTGRDALHVLGIQCVWAISLTVMSRWLWTFFTRRVVIQGG